MAQSHVSGVLPLSPGEAWTVFSDLSRFGEWLTLHDSWCSDLPSTLSTGTRITEQLTLMGMLNTIEWTVDVYEPPSTLAISGAGLAGAQVAFTLSVQPDGDQSTATIDAEFTGQIMVGAIGEAVEKNVTLALETSLARLRELVG